jgi:hypothetical protein
LLVAEYKGRKFYYNQFWMEIYEEVNGRLVKKRDFHKWESKLEWVPEHNVLASEQINQMNGFGAANRRMEIEFLK